MSYISRRCREIRAEERRRNEGEFVINAEPNSTYRLDGFLLPYGPADRSIQQLQDEAFDRYEETLRDRNPIVYPSPISFRGRGG